MLVISLGSGGAPGLGGMIIGDLYVKYTDGRPQSYLSQTFQSH